MEEDIRVHKLALEETIKQLYTHLDTLGFERPTTPAAWIHKAISSQSVLVGLDALAPVLDTCNRMQNSEDRRRPISRQLHLEGKKNKSTDISRWVESTVTAPNITADSRIAHPDPDVDSEAETAWNPRVCYTDLSVPCSRQEWLSWVSKAWEDYSSRKAQEKKLKETHEHIIATYNILASNGVLGDSALIPKKYATDISKQRLDDMGKELSACRKLRSRIHELLPAFEWCV